MKIKCFHLIVFLILSINASAQTDIESIVVEGIEYHDRGQYDMAIETYKKALKIDPKSTLVNYEIAFSYFQKGNYKEAIHYSDIVLKQNQDFLLEAYLVKGSSLDMLGKTEESIKLFKKAIGKTNGHYLLFYNLGLNYYKIGDFENAEESVINAINLNPNHASSHLMLANIHNLKGNSIQTLLSSHYFLFLEPNSKRSKDAYSMLMKNFSGNVTMDEEMPNNINIVLSPSNDSQFAAAELMISMLEASKSLEENEGKSEDQLFVENTGKFFMILGELKKKENKEIWWTFYAAFFYDVAKSEHLETYCKYISQIGNENAKKWLEDNPSAIDNFDNWLKEY